MLLLYATRFLWKKTRLKIFFLLPKISMEKNLLDNSLLSSLLLNVQRLKGAVVPPGGL
jgi:hypothetical protein